MGSDHRLGNLALPGGESAADRLHDFGAEQVVGYTADFRKGANGCDAAFDTVGGDVAMQPFAFTNPSGHAAVITSGAHAPKPDRVDVTAMRRLAPVWSMGRVAWASSATARIAELCLRERVTLHTAFLGAQFSLFRALR